MNNFFEYQINKGFSINTVSQHQNAINHFLEWCASNRKKPKAISYNDLMKYIAYCQALGNKTSAIRNRVKAIDHYFNYIELSPNPAILVKIKGMTRTIPHHLLNKEDLEHIFSQQRSHGLAGKRDKILLSLVVFQAVGSTELEKIEVKDVNLMEGKIYIPSTRTTNSRTLELKPLQYMLFQDYLLNIRPVILKELGGQTEQFLINSKGKKQELRGVISYLLKYLRQKCPQIRDLQQIRQSVISIWVKEHGLRQAQYMSGHRYVSSTERYNEDKLEGLKAEMEKHFPI